MNSCDVVAGAVRDYWRSHYPQDVIVFFQQKYSWADEWETCGELIECFSDNDYESMAFLSDFCEGQTEVRDIVIVPLSEVITFYYHNEIERGVNGESV